MNKFDFQVGNNSGAASQIWSVVYDARTVSEFEDRWMDTLRDLHFEG